MLKQRIGPRLLRVFAIAVALISLLWLLGIASTSRVQAGDEKPGLAFYWVGGDPPRYVCQGDKVDFMFVLRYTSPDLPIAPLTLGAMDLKVSSGFVSTNHWPLNFNATPVVGGGFTYWTKENGLENLLLTYNYGEYSGSVSVQFRVHKCDYRVKVKLQRDSYLKNMESHATLDAEGGFRIKADRTSRGGQLFTGRGSTDVIIRGGLESAKANVTSIVPGNGQGTFQIIGEMLPDGRLELDFLMASVTLAGDTNLLTAEGKSLTGTVGAHKWSADSNNFWGLRFPAGGGTQTLGEPPFSAPPAGATITEKVEITITPGGAQ